MALLLVSVFRAVAQPVTPSEILVPRLPVEPRIDGVLAPGEWPDGARHSLRYQVQPGNNATPSAETHFRVAMDETHLYLAVEAQDEAPDLVRARVRPRDELDDEDIVLLTLDTFLDRRRAYRFSVNPKGVQRDGIFTEGNETDYAWDGIFRSAGQLSGSGYVVELAIPWKTLRFRSGRTLVWGLHVERVIPRKNEVISWAPIARDVNGYLLQAGTLRINREQSGNTVVDVIPSFTGFAQTQRTGVEDTNRFLKGDPGLTVNYSLAANLTLSVAANPDFSQVETDVPLADVNQRFELFFPERRPFFLEGGEVFRPLQDTGAAINLVNTRRIVDPDFGIKLTGKVGRFNLGYLAAADRAPRLLAPQGTSAATQDAQFQILRLQRDLSDDSAIGFTGTLRSHAGESNAVAAIDYRFRINSSTVVFGQHIGTRTARPDRFGNSAHPSPKFASAHVARLSIERPNWFVRESFRSVGRDFAIDTGFIERTGIASSFTWAAYRIRPEQQSRRFVELSPQLFMNLLRTREGKWDQTFVDPTFFFILPRAVESEVFVSFVRDHFAGKDLPYRFLAANGSAALSKFWALQWNVALGGAAFYDDTNPQVGRDGIRTTAGLTLRPNTRLSSEIRYIHTSLRSQETGNLLFLQNIWRERTLFQFNRFWSFRSITEYNAARGRLGFSELLTYLPSPNTAFYLGYNDLLVNPIRFGRVTGGEDVLEGWNRQSRVFFFKITYNWRI